ncbi:MAG: hypothetical protein AAF481_08745 [Acidobacteriota bacterium]
MNDTRPRPRRLRLAGIAVVLGLLVEAVTLAWSHPLAFLVFLGVGLPLTGLGVLLYLWELVTARSPRRSMYPIPGGTKPG